MRVPIFVLILSIPLVIPGCTGKIDNIQPTHDRPISYKNWTCEELGIEQSRLIIALSTASGEELRTPSTDPARKIPLMVIVSSLSGSDDAAEIIRLRSELDTLQDELIRKQCGIKIVPIFQIIDKNIRYNPSTNKERIERWIIIPGPMFDN